MNGSTVGPAAKDAGGFTLVEILTAITILAIVMTLVYSAFGRTADTIQRVSTRADVQHKARVIFSRITEEIVAADWEAGNTRTIFVGNNGLVGNRSVGTLRFSSRSHVQIRPETAESDLNLIAYWLSNGALLRREERNLLSLTDRTVETEELTQGVAGFDLRYWDGQEWQDAWDASKRKNLPAAVLVELSLETAEGPTERFVSMVTVPLSRLSRAVFEP